MKRPFEPPEVRCRIALEMEDGILTGSVLADDGNSGVNSDGQQIGGSYDGGSGSGFNHSWE